MGNDTTQEKHLLGALARLTPEGRQEFEKYVHTLMYDLAEADRMALELKAQVEGMRGGATV